MATIEQINKNNMKKPKRYEIETIEQLVNISTVENYERLAVDFLLWLNHINNFLAKYKESNPNSEQPKVQKFIWIDDGKNELKNIQIHNIKTGEVTNHKPKKK